MPLPPESDSGDDHRRMFPETRWTLIHRARQAGEVGEVAIDELCRRYWYPLYAFLRGRGCSKEEAEDVTQAFFAMLLRQGIFQLADAGRGRLRSLLLTALKNFHSNWDRNAHAQKRGGGRELVSIDVDDAEERYLVQTADSRDPESIYLTAWARTLIEQARERLREAYQHSPRPDVAAALDPYLDPDEDRVPYREFAERFSMREAALRLQVFRLRQKLGDLLREEVRQTVDTPEEITNELNWLKQLLTAE
ncbi:MAG: sigma-70 family RNA polymerase sigma factor [Verrucomicrobiae bacterium]|nr:sigma-70 family RNA polymerase sigma factor [Verrucomicrobiae bacterium]